MRGFWLLMPFLFVRFILLGVLRKEAVERAAHCAPMAGRERIVYYVYQISNIVIFLYLFFCRVRADLSGWFYSGVFFYGLGLCLCVAAVVCFSAPDGDGLNRNGVYRFSRNPMYVAYFICFMGMALLVQSLVLAAVVVVFQVSAHWIILAEERWCLENFGTEYKRYMGEVRRYL